MINYKQTERCHLLLRSEFLKSWTLTENGTTDEMSKSSSIGEFLVYFAAMGALFKCDSLATADNLQS